MINNCKYDKIIIGAGLYGLYAALFCAKLGENILVLECDDAPFKRASYINQARVHMGYHYPRSISTAIKSRGYFERFNEDYGFCIQSSFDQIYATSKKFSWSNAEQFRKFCKDANIPCEDVPTNRFFKDNVCDGAFMTTEYTYDAQILKDYFIEEINKYSNIKILYSFNINTIEKEEDMYKISNDDEWFYSSFVLNATYASINQIHKKIQYEPFGIKYELCEIILCKVDDYFKNLGITIMDGPFFSIMPFGKTEYHSLTTVTFTPHATCFDNVPNFPCQLESGGYCSDLHLWNCNDCPYKPDSAWIYMSKLAKKYLKDKYKFEYSHSLFSMKPILKASEINDSRPTVIKQFSNNPTFISVLSGKINTVYDLDEVLINDNK